MVNTYKLIFNQSFLPAVPKEYDFSLELPS